MAAQLLRRAAAAVVGVLGAVHAVKVGSAVRLEENIVTVRVYKNFLLFFTGWISPVLPII